MGALLAGGLPGLLNQSSAQMVDGSLKFDKSVGNYQRRTHTAGNRKTYTWSGWIKRSSDLSTNEFFFGGGPDGNNNTEQITFFFMPSGAFRITTGSIVFRETTRLFRDPSSFYHLVVAFDTTLGSASARIKIYVNGSLVTSYTSQGDPGEDANTGINAAVEHVLGKGPGSDYSASTYNFDGSMSQVYFIDGQALGPGYFGFTDPLTGTWRPKKVRQGDTSPVNDGTVWSSGTKTTTGSGLYSGSWDKAFDGNLNIGVANGAPYVYNNSSATLIFPKPLTGYISVWGSNGSNSATDSAETDQIILSDGSIFDVSGITSPNGKWYNFGYKKNITSIRIEHNAGSGQGTFLRAIAINGVELLDNDTSSVDFGTNGFYLPMDNDDFNIDKSGKGNNWTKQSFSGTFNDPDVLKDSPSGAVSGGRAQTGITTTSSAPSNYATLNPININDMTGTTSVTVSDGNLTVANARNGYFGSALSTLSMTSGKYYCEATVDSNDDTTLACGILKIDPLEYRWGTSDEQIGYFANGYGYRSNNGNKVNNNSNSSYGASYGNGNTIGIAFNLDAGTVTFYKDNVSQGVAYSSIPAGQYAFGFSCSETNNKWKVNFGQKPFKFPPPVGFQVLNAANVRPETVITRPDQYVGTVLYRGTGSAFNINYNFSPDFAWVKGRTFSSNHQWSDTVRNRLVGGIRRLELPTGQAQDPGGPGFINSGLSINTNAAINTNEQNFVAWAWKAGGNKNTFNVDDVGYASAAAAGLTGAVNCTQEGASVGTKQGFSITVQEATSSSGATMQIPHGLTQKPDFIIGKDIDTGSTNWGVYHASLGATKKIELDQTGGSAANANYWDETEPTSSVIYTNAASFMYTSSSFVLYSWHNVPGLQKFGLYNGSGGGNGPFIELGFKPSILIIKRTDSSGDHWFIHDGVRNTFNPAKNRLYPSWNQTEFSNVDALDLLSNGFKIRTGDTSWNADTGTYIYAAWAEASASNLYSGQSNAR